MGKKVKPSKRDEALSSIWVAVNYATKRVVAWGDEREIAKCNAIALGVNNPTIVRTSDAVQYGDLIWPRKTRAKAKKKEPAKDNQEMGINGEPGAFLMRIFRFRKRGKKDAHILCKCGCCDYEVDIYHGSDECLEINGVNASIEDWQRILLPLLNVEKDAELFKKLFDLSIEAANALWALEKGKTPDRDPIAINQDIHNLRTKIGKRIIIS